MDITADKNGRSDIDDIGFLGEDFLGLVAEDLDFGFVENLAFA